MALFDELVNGTFCWISWDSLTNYGDTNHHGPSWVDDVRRSIGGKNHEIRWIPRSACWTLVDSTLVFRHPKLTGAFYAGNFRE